MKTTMLLFLPFLLLIPKQHLAQHHTALSKEPIETQKEKTNRGTSVFFFEWNIDRNEIFESKSSGGISKSFDLGYGYFFADRYFFAFKTGFYAFANKSIQQSVFERNYHVEASVRRYFFKRAAFYVDTGVRSGLYMNKSETIDIGLFYVMPKIGIGYEYLINDFHPVLNNRFGVSIESSTLIPTKNEFKETSIPCFPQMELKFGVHYYFNKINNNSLKNNQLTK